MAHPDLPSHPTYNDSNPLLDPSTASLGADQDDEGGQLDRRGDTARRGSLLNGHHVRGSSEDTILPALTSVSTLVDSLSLSDRFCTVSQSDVPSADDLHDHTDNQPPKRQSAQRTRNIIPEALLELDNSRVSHQDGQKRQIDGDAHGNDKQQSKRIKTGNEGAMKVHTLNDDEDSDLTDLSDEEEEEEEEAKMTDSKATDDTRDSSPAPEEAPEEVSHCQDLEYQLPSYGSISTLF
jgi:hypothetical protein